MCVCVTSPYEVVVEPELLQGFELQYPPGHGAEAVVIEQHLRQRVGQPHEGHLVHSVLPQPVVGQMQRLQAGMHVGEDIAWDALNVVVVEGEVAKGHWQEGWHVDQLIMGQVQGVQFPESYATYAQRCN